jgi:hypothetical protein
MSFTNDGINLGRISETLVTLAAALAAADSAHRAYNRADLVAWFTTIEVNQDELLMCSQGRYTAMTQSISLRTGIPQELLRNVPYYRAKFLGASPIPYLTPEEKSFLNNNPQAKIHVIKMVRERAQCGLVEAKMAVDRGEVEP